VYITANSVDDVLHRVFQRLLRSHLTIHPSKGEAKEIVGILIRLSNPRMRLSRTDSRGVLFSCLGEWLWYMSGTNELDFIRYYIRLYEKFSDDGKSVYGGYGPRLFGKGTLNQVHRIYKLLKSKPDSRQAVIQIFDAADLKSEHKDIPCTCTLQFMIREGNLHLITNMRSNDAYMGLPHDFFAFTMLQEVMARALNVNLGHYRHFVGSLHLYRTDEDRANLYLKEGWQRRVPMPPMPVGDPWPAIKTVLDLESRIRAGERIDVSKILLDPYWLDLVRILDVYSVDALSTNRTRRGLVARIASDVYSPYITKRIDRPAKKGDQLEFEID